MFPVSDLPPSNTGGESITEKALAFYKGGGNREEIQLKDLETFLSVSEFNKNSEQITYFCTGRHTKKMYEKPFFFTTGGVSFNLFL